MHLVSYLLHIIHILPSTKFDKAWNLALSVASTIVKLKLQYVSFVTFCNCINVNYIMAFWLIDVKVSPWKWYCILITLIPSISVNQYLHHNLGYKQKIQAIWRNQVYFSSSNVSTDTTVIVKDYMLSEKFTFCFKITIKWNLTKSHATRLKSAKYKLMW